MKTKHTFRIMPVLIPAILLISCLAFGQDAKSENGSFQKTSSGLDSYFNSMMSTQKYAGLGACLIKGDKIVWQNCYGYSDVEAQKPLTMDNIFLLCSLSKTVTATALMQLYDKGLFKPDDDINNYLPFKVRNPNFPDKPITFRMLLTHTGGFADVYATGNKINLAVDGDSQIPFGEYVEGLFTPGGKYYSKDYFSTVEPGTKHEYSNISFSLMAYLAERMSKKDFSDYCKENIFKPLEMNNTGWHLKDLDVQKIVYPYMLLNNDGPVYKKVEHFGMPGYPEGMLRTSMLDFANFLSAFINKGTYKNYRMLKSETVELMLSPQGIKYIPSRSFKITDIGLTWIINEVEGETLYSMNGFSPSFFSNAYFSAKDGTTFIYYYTGVSMQNMAAMTEITKKLFYASKE